MRRQKLIGFVFSSLHLSVFISFFNIFWTHLFLCLFHPQLLPVPAPGGRRSLEDQTELLGVTAARGKRLTPCLQLILSCHSHINSFLVKVIAAVKVALFCGFSSGINTVYQVRFCPQSQRSVIALILSCTILPEVFPHPSSHTYKLEGRPVLNP